MPYTFRPHDPAVMGALAALGRAVASARARQGLSQEALEARSGVDQTTVSRFERGKAPGLRADRVAGLLVGLGVDHLDIDLRPARRRSP